MLHHRGYVDLPDWSSNLKLPYWKIRIEGRNKAIRRKCYRQIQAEKLRLVELGYDIETINAICRYLSSFRLSSATKLMGLLNTEAVQLKLPF